MISSPHTFHKSPPTHPWWLFHPSFRPLRLFSEIKSSTSHGMTFSKPGIFRPALCSASPPSSSGSPCTPSPSPTYHQQLKESGSTTGGKSGQKQVKRGRKISDKNQVLLLGPSVHTWLSNQAGTTAGGGLYSTTQLATHPTKQDDNPEKFGGNCTPGTKLLLNTKTLSVRFHLLGQACLIDCCGGNQAGWRFSIQGLVHCTWYVWLKAINHFSAAATVFTCIGCWVQKATCRQNSFSPNLGQIIPKIILTQPRSTFTQFHTRVKQVVDINIYKMAKRKQLSFILWYKLIDL